MQRIMHRSRPIATAALAVALLGVFAALAPRAEAGLVYDQGFEQNAYGWQTGSGYGTLVLVGTGTSGITAAGGSRYAVLTQTDAGPYTRFDGYRSAWPGTFTAQIDVYLDPDALSSGEGFDYSTAINNPSGDHQRDFIFHVAKYTSDGPLFVGGSNNSNNGNPNTNLENLNHYEVTSAGWYTLESVFRDAGDGTLAVDLNLRNASGSLLFTETRNNSLDVIGSTVGGNRYGWFPLIDVDGGIAVDNVSLDIAAVPEPSNLAMAAVASLIGAGYGWRRRRRTVTPES